MGCLKRLLTCGCFFTLSNVFLLGWLVLFLAESRNADARKVREVPVKTLAEALTSDGPAWVKVRVEPASGATLLQCGGSPALWIRRQGSEMHTQEIRRQGKWQLRNVWKSFHEPPETIPIDLKADSALVTISNWVGIEIWPDLLHMRRENRYTGAENPMETGTDTAAVASDPDPDILSTAPVGGAETASTGMVVKRKMEEVFLPPGTEAWALGLFEKGVPQVFLRDRFFLTGLGRDRFAQELEMDIGVSWHYSWFLVLGWGIFGLLFLRTLLKTS